MIELSIVPDSGRQAREDSLLGAMREECVLWKILHRREKHVGVLEGAWTVTRWEEDFWQWKRNSNYQHVEAGNGMTGGWRNCWNCCQIHLEYVVYLLEWWQMRLQRAFNVTLRTLSETMASPRLVLMLEMSGAVAKSLVVLGRQLTPLKSICVRQAWIMNAQTLYSTPTSWSEKWGKRDLLEMQSDYWEL